MLVLPGQLGAHMMFCCWFSFSPINLSYLSLLGGFTSTTLASEAPYMISEATPVSFLWNATSREGLHIKNEKLNQTAEFYYLK